jgi:hypothetical protein
MEMKHFITALENINCLICQVIGAMQGEEAKKMLIKALQPPTRLIRKLCQSNSNMDKAL